MANESFRWRTILEVAVISLVIYLILGTPGLSISPKITSTGESDVPVSRAKAESLVYSEKNLRCSKHESNTHIFSTRPLVMYVDGFLSESEANHLVDIRYAT